MMWTKKWEVYNKKKDWGRKNYIKIIGRNAKKYIKWWGSFKIRFICGRNNCLNTKIV